MSKPPRTIQHVQAFLANITEATVMSFTPELVDEETAKIIAAAVREAVLSGEARKGSAGEWP